jgi:hypothetical protein
VTAASSDRCFQTLDGDMFELEDEFSSQLVFGIERGTAMIQDAGMVKTPVSDVLGHIVTHIRG